MAKSRRWTAGEVESIQKDLKGLKMPIIKPPTITANVLTKHALKLLDLHGWNVWRQNNGATFDPTKKVFRKGSSTKGIPDIIGYHRKTSQFIACEIKIGKDRLSVEQMMFIDSLRVAGGVGMVIKNLDDLERQIGIINQRNL